MLRNAKVGDRVWDIIYGWGNIISVIKNYPFPIAVDFSNGKTISYKFNGKNNDTDINPRLFWDEIKFEIPEKPFDLESELRKLKIVEFKKDEKNYFLLWDSDLENIEYDYLYSQEYPLIKYFNKESVDDFMDNIKGKNITREEFFKAYNIVFVGK
ncbi:MAG: hypothetical protein ACLT40_01345 [Fusobacterium sp.]